MPLSPCVEQLYFISYCTGTILHNSDMLNGSGDRYCFQEDVFKVSVLRMMLVIGLRDSFTMQCFSTPMLVTMSSEMDAGFGLCFFSRCAVGIEEGRGQILLSFVSGRPMQEGEYFRTEDTQQTFTSICLCCSLSTISDSLQVSCLKDYCNYLTSDLSNQVLDNLMPH